MIWFAAALVSFAALAWGFRLAGQAATGRAPYFRDMTFGVAYGYIFAVAALAWLVWAYMQGRSPDPAVANKFFFLRIAVEGFVVFAIGAWLFRLLGRNVGTKGTKRLFRSMPLTASFGIMMILIYVFVAVFASFLAPYGQAEIIRGVAANIMPGGDIALGGNPDFPLGTDQIGRDILSRLIYGAQNTVGIAFATTVIAFMLGGSMGFLAATLGGWLDQLLSRIVDVLMAIPSLIFALLLIDHRQRLGAAAGYPADLFHDPDHRGDRQHPRLPVVPRCGAKHCRDGLHRGGQAAWRRHGLSDVQGNPAQCDSPFAGGIRAAVLFCVPDHCLAVVSWRGYPAALGRLGDNGARSRRFREFCTIRADGGNAAPAGRGRDCLAGRCGQFRGGLDAAPVFGVEGLT